MEITLVFDDDVETLSNSLTLLKSPMSVMRAYKKFHIFNSIKITLACDDGLQGTVTHLYTTEVTLVCDDGLHALSHSLTTEITLVCYECIQALSH